MSETELPVSEIEGRIEERPPRYVFEPIVRLMLYLFTIGVGLVLVGFAIAPFIFAFKIKVTDVFDFQSNLPLMTIYYISATFAVLLISFGFILFVDKLPAEALGFNFREKWVRELLLGISIGALATSFIFIISYVMGWVRVTGFIFEKPPAKILSTLLLTILLMASIAVVEETMVRGYVLRTLKWGYGAFSALIISSAFFSMLHFLNPGATLFGFLGTMAAGIVLGYGYLATGRLWLPIGFHFGWNFFLGPVFGFPVSGIEFDSWIEQIRTANTLWLGGDFGPEAGLLSFIALLLSAVAIRWFTKKSEKARS
ncbi:MAG: type II CAAX endopeptidase family protein [Armatimonadota bacterium]|nr:type II CAAX endopeptidase family protein [Armatimonadota bacterium]